MKNVTNFFAELNAATAWNAAVKFNRNNALPLDAGSVFASLSDLETYAASSPVAYPGQVCVVIAEGSAKPYVLKTEMVSGTQTGIPVPIDSLSQYFEIDGEDVVFNFPGDLEMNATNVQLYSDEDLGIDGTNVAVRGSSSMLLDSTGGAIQIKAGTYTDGVSLDVQCYSASGSGNMQDGKIRGVASPSQGNDAANKAYVDSTVRTAIDTIPKFGIVVVNSLPVQGSEGTIYLVKTGSAATNLYTEYIWLGTTYIEAQAATTTYLTVPQSGTAASLVLYNFASDAGSAMTFTILDGESVVRSYSGDSILTRSQSATAGYYNFTTTNAQFLDYLSTTGYKLAITIPAAKILSNVYQFVRITYSNGRWEELGTQEIDLTNYLTKTEASSTYLTQTAASSDYMAKFGTVSMGTTTAQVNSDKEVLRFANKSGNTTRSAVSLTDTGVVTISGSNSTHQVTVGANYASYYQSPDFSAAAGNVIPDKQYVDDKVAQAGGSLIWQGVTGGSTVLTPTDSQSNMYINDTGAIVGGETGASYYTYTIARNDSLSITTTTKTGFAAILTTKAATVGAMTSDNTYLQQSGTDNSRHTYSVTDSTSGIQMLIVNSFGDAPVVRKLS